MKRKRLAAVIASSAVVVLSAIFFAARNASDSQQETRASATAIHENYFLKDGTIIYEAKSEKEFTLHDLKAAQRYPKVWGYLRDHYEPEEKIREISIYLENKPGSGFKIITKEEPLEEAGPPNPAI